MNTSHKVGALVAAIALLAGCSSVPAGAPVAKPSTPSVHTVTPDVSAPEPFPSETSAEEGDRIGRFGETYTWEDGIEVTISQPSTYRPSDSAAGTDGFKKFVLFTVTVKNGGKDRFDPGLFGINGLSGDTEASQVFDSAKDIGGGPNASLLPGRSVKFKAAFGVADASDIVLEVSPSWEHDDVMFSSTGK
jgi:hypothetical protein